MPTKPKFVIDRKRWYRGKGDSESRLLVPGTQKMCCLGQVARQCGLKPKNIRDVSSPANVSTVLHDQFPKWLLGICVLDAKTIDSPACTNAMAVNDDPEITDKDRERQLKAIFKKHGATLTFIN